MITMQAGTTLDLIGGSDTVDLAAQSYLRSPGTAASIGFISGTAGAETIVQSAASLTVHGFDPAIGDQIDRRGILPGVTLTC